jgi:hypothetical protein
LTSLRERNGGNVNLERIEQLWHEFAIYERTP